MGTLHLALIGLLVLCIAAFSYYLNPRFFIDMEGFTTIAVDADVSPKCVSRSRDAQELLQIVNQATAHFGPASESRMAFEELKLIVQKATCMDADISGMGAGPYTSFALPYNTQHDIEPTANFVGRCLNNAVRSEDIEILFDKMQTRGNELIQVICDTQESRQKVFNLFHSVLAVAARNITINCLKQQPVMDIPSGVRDPGYYTPPALTRLSSYKEDGR